MTRTLQLLRGTTAQNDAFTGAAGEVTVDTDVNGLRVHDGSTAGGHAIYTKQQTDTLLSAKANDNAVVHLAEEETISGSKIFNSAPRLKNNLTPSTTATKSSTIEDVLLAISQNTAGKNDGASIIRRQKVDGNREVLYRAGFRNSDDTGSLWPDVCVGVAPDNKKYVDLSHNDRSYACSISDNTDESIRIATTQWVKNNRSIWSSNCITNIPQDIKLTLSNGTLTLKAGSKVYVPNGVGVFDEVVIASDIALRGYQNLQGMIFVTTGKTLHFTSLSQIYSGTSGTLSSGNVWYDTTTNKIFRSSNGSSWNTQVGFPICIVTSSSGAIASIDQVFNGFGYIGSTVFVLPGVKGLIPDGRNANGSLKNITTNDFTTVKTLQVNTSTAKIAMYSGGGLGSQTKNFGLNEAENYNYDSGILTNALEVARVIVDSSAKITAFTPKTAFHAVDYSDWNEHRVVEFRETSSATEYKAYRKYSDGSIDQWGFINNATWSSYQYTVTLPVAMRDALYASVATPYGNPHDDDYITNIQTQNTTTLKIRLRSGQKSCSWIVHGVAA